MGLHPLSTQTKAQITDLIIENRIALVPEARRGGGDRNSEILATINDPDVSLGDIKRIEDELGIERGSVNRQDRIDAIRERLSPEGGRPDIAEAPTPEAPPAPARGRARKQAAAPVANEELASGIRLLAQGTTREERQGTPPAATAGGPVKRFGGRVTGGPLGTIQPRTRGEADQELVLPNGGADQGLIHLDSEIGGLWTDLYGDDRPKNSLLNEITDIGHKLGRGQISLDQALDELKRLKQQEGGSSPIGNRIQSAIDAIDAPKVELNFPEGTPDVIKRYVNDVAAFSTARQPGRGGEPSLVDQLMETIRRIGAGEGDFRSADSDLAAPRTNIHESVDGGYQLQRLGARMSPGGPEYQEVRRWVRDSYIRAGR
jgi:hypothetical protein